MAGTQDDFGFIVPQMMVDDIPEEDIPAPNPFEVLEAEEPEPKEAEEEAEAEEFESLEDEYRILASLKRRRDELKAQHSEASNEYEAQRGRMMRAMKAQGTKQFKSTTVEKGSCHFNSSYTVGITDPSTFIPWVKQNAEELLTVNSKTLTKHVREEYKNKGVPIDDPSFPPGLRISELDTLTVSVPKERKK